MTLAAWPRFEPAHFLNLDSLPATVAESFRQANLPKNFFERRYVVRPLLEEVQVPGRGKLIWFGDLGLWGGIYADPVTGEVVEMYPPAEPRLVNASLARFSQTVKTLIEMFPYYRHEADLEEREATADRLADVIRGIDPAALGDVDNYWSTFLDDLAIGDFATEDVVGSD